MCCFKLKALWIYLGTSFTNPQKYLKKIKKANRLAEYEEAVDSLFREQELIFNRIEPRKPLMNLRLIFPSCSAQIKLNRV